MGAGQSTIAQPQLVERRNIQCDSNGRGEFRRETTNGQPAVPGFYRFVWSANVNEVRMKGIMINGDITQRHFALGVLRGNACQIRYLPGSSMTPVLKGFEGQFIGIPNRQLRFEIWWLPLNYTGTG